MAASAKRALALVRERPGLRLRSAVSASFLIWVLVSSSTRAQVMQSVGGQADSPSSVQGKVLNRVTHEPISRALVFSPDQRYATLTDNEGRFEFKFPPQEPESAENLTTTSDASVFRARQLR